MNRLPLWARQTAALFAIYAVAMLVVARWMPWREIDQSLYMRTARAGSFQSNAITVVDVQPSPPDDPLANRRLIADFLNKLAASGEEPRAVILDFTFDPCQAPCNGSRLTVRDALVTAIEHAQAVHVAVFGIENLTQQSIDPYGGETTGALEDHDAIIYGPRALAGGAGHTIVHVADGSGMTFYHPCYENVTMPADGGLAHSEDVWAVVMRVQPNFDPSTCSTRPTTFSVGPRLSAAAATYSTIPRSAPTYYAITQNNSFPKGIELNDYVILGTLEQDTLELDAGLAGTSAGTVWEKLHGPGSLNIPGPEILAWALSDKLAQQSASYFATQPVGGVLYVLVPAFSAVTLLAYTACFLFLKRLRLKTARSFLPWITAALALIIGLGIFVATQLLIDVVFHRVQPQVTLISFGIVLSSLLSGVRGNQLLAGLAPEQDEKYDYDVFISYSHDDTPWVRERVFAPLEKARLRNGHPLSIFFDKKAIYVGDDWRTKLTLAVINSRFVIPVYSANYFKREGKGYCTFELDTAYNRWIQLGKASGYLLPVVLGRIDVPPEYGQAQFVTLDDEPDAIDGIVAKIVERLSRETHDDSA